MNLLIYDRLISFLQTESGEIRWIVANLIYFFKRKNHL